MWKGFVKINETRIFYARYSPSIKHLFKTLLVLLKIKIRSISDRTHVRCNTILNITDIPLPDVFGYLIMYFFMLYAFCAPCRGNLILSFTSFIESNKQTQHSRHVRLAWEKTRERCTLCPSNVPRSIFLAKVAIRVSLFSEPRWNVKIIMIYRQIIPRAGSRDYYYITMIFHHWRLLRWIIEGSRNNWYLLSVEPLTESTSLFLLNEFSFWQMKRSRPICHDENDESAISAGLDDDPLWRLGIRYTESWGFCDRVENFLD